MDNLTNQTVTFTNKKTGEVKRMTVDEARRWGAPDDVILEKLQAKQQLEQGLQTGDFSVKTEGTEISAKDKALAQTGMLRVKGVAEIYSKDPSVLTKQLEPGKFASRNFDKEIYDAADALLRLRTGAQANESEIRGYMRTLAPTFGDSPEVVQNKLNNMMQDFSLYTGQEKFEPITITGQGFTTKGKKPLSEKVVGAGGGLINLLFGSTKNIIQDVAQTAPAGARNKANEQLLIQGIALENQARAEPDPLRKRAMMRQAQEIFTQVSSESQNIAGGFSPSIEANPLARGIGAGLELYGGAKTLTGLLKAPGTIKNIPQKLNIRSVWGKAREEATKVSNAKINPRRIVKAGQEYLESDPSAQKLFDKALPAIESIKTPSTLLKRMRVWKSAYTSASKVGKSSKAGLFDTLYKAASQEMKTKAPEVAKYTERLRKTYTIPRTVSKGVRIAGTIAGAEALRRYLFGGGRSY